MPKEGVSLFGHDDILRYEEMLRVIRASLELGVVKVRLTGGEPLIRRGILSFLSSIKALEGLQDISLTTNGILLELMAHGIFQAGVKRINVSLDSLKSIKYKEITRGGSLECVLRGIDEAQKIGFSPIKINVVAIKGFNDDEILDFARLTLERPFQVRFIEFMPFGQTGQDHADGFVSNKVVMENIDRMYPIEPIEKEISKLDGPARLYRIKHASGEIGFISAMSEHFCKKCNRLRLTSDGRLRMCLFSDEEVNLKELLRGGCSDAELVALIDRAIKMKPRDLKESTIGMNLRKCSMEMSSIGG
jgi:cyclic pyranopterin phosphate synthase